MALEFNIRHLERTDLSLKGELPIADLDFDFHDPQVHLTQKPLRYDLTVAKVGHEILVKGRLKVPLECECVRCLKPFKFDIDLADWTALLPLEGEEKVEVKGDSVDLTPFIREDILLSLPQHPLCKTDCAGLPKRAVNKAKKPLKGAQTKDSSAWSALDRLKF